MEDNSTKGFVGKTFPEFANTMLEVKVFTEQEAKVFIENNLKHYFGTDAVIRYNNLNPLYGAFNWKNSPEGYDYWSEISHKIEMYSEKSEN